MIKTVVVAWPVPGLPPEVGTDPGRWWRRAREEAAFVANGGTLTPVPSGRLAPLTGAGWGPVSERAWSREGAAALLAGGPLAPHPVDPFRGRADPVVATEPPEVPLDGPWMAAGRPEPEWLDILGGGGTATALSALWRSGCHDLALDWWEAGHHVWRQPTGAAWWLADRRRWVLPALLSTRTGVLLVAESPLGGVFAATVAEMVRRDAGWNGGWAGEPPGRDELISRTGGSASA